MSDTTLPVRMTLQDFKDRKHNLSLTDPQWEALARGKNLIDEDPNLPGWWVLSIEPKNWILLCGFEDVFGNEVTREGILSDEQDVGAVYMDSKGHFRLGPGEAYDEDDNPTVSS